MCQGASKERADRGQAADIISVTPPALRFCGADVIGELMLMSHRIASALD